MLGIPASPARPLSNDTLHRKPGREFDIVAGRIQMIQPLALATPLVLGKTAKGVRAEWH